MNTEPSASVRTHAAEVRDGERFKFGENWRRFLATLDDERIAVAENSLIEMLEMKSLEGRRFLDVGCGSGLFSLAARRLGARVHSFDYDPESVACAETLRQRYFPGDDTWTIEQGSALDEAYVRALGSFDIVYSWGVLHHTGEMWKALDVVQLPVAAGGLLYIAIYNDQGSRSRIWKAVKKTYCANALGQVLMIGVFCPYFFFSGLVRDLLALRNPLRRYAEYKSRRGMSMVRDWIDWIGGYPFEVAKPEELFDFYRARGFTLCKLKTTLSMGNNLLVLRKESRS